VRCDLCTALTYILLRKLSKRNANVSNAYSVTFLRVKIHADAIRYLGAFTVPSFSDDQERWTKRSSSSAAVVK
jgi:hypothetical protein